VIDTHDHYPIVVNFKFSEQSTPTPLQTKYITKIDYKELGRLLNEENWTRILNEKIRINALMFF